MSGANCKEVDPRKEEEEEEEEEEMVTGMGSYKGKVRMVRGDPSDEMMLLWGLQQPTFSKPNAFVSQSSLNLTLDACGRRLSISQSPSSLGAPGVTGSVMWDSGIVLGKFLENAVETGLLGLQGKKVVELGAGCGLVGCIAALLGAQVILTDMPDRLRLLKKNIEDNMYGDVRGCATANELTWGDRPEPELVEPLPDFGTVYLPDSSLVKAPLSNDLAEVYKEVVIGSDVIYSEEAVTDLLDTLVELSGINTTIILAGELRNGNSLRCYIRLLLKSVTPLVRVDVIFEAVGCLADAILEYFLEAAMEEFMIGRVDQAGWHPDYRSPRVAMYVLVMK
ncbi:Nicotinamide N-methyltransferase-like protein [Cynara cardunculus var. scolymus]|uniref:Nicotinamide N-methyltransferase-like protein n=1 Tax=Cynara cardunculus var. scolymus TaxID=59895 RepID=A0A103XBH3_CYNCS|nr:Nicotinamide N-methyltransferase-like protein [Cynara cardunculus var. scolymus]